MFPLFFHHPEYEIRINMSIEAFESSSTIYGYKWQFIESFCLLQDIVLKSREAESNSGWWSPWFQLNRYEIPHAIL